MSQTFNIYCDESCHLENDNQKVMVLGAAWCPLDKAREIANRLHEIKARHNLNPKFEVKWTKVSSAKIQFYLDWMDYFFDDDDLHFRALIIPDKTKLRHKDFENQDHDTWYYKMYFNMLKVIFGPTDQYRIYLDIKDTRGASKVKKLEDVLCNNLYDFSRDIIKRLQLVHSHELEILQLADLLIGTVSYANRKLKDNKGKVQLVERMKERSGYSLEKTTLYREGKLNLLSWNAQEIQE
ncbi:MAG: DUF3800 domain-containing protein [Nitrospinae bacterium]|nr:DUF3800 domain-containing protein [Nitrospinota bacterium]